MRRSKRIKIDNREITVNELTIRQWMGLYGDLQKITPFSMEFWNKILPVVSDLDATTLLDMAPSEIETVVDAATEVNKTLIDTLKKSQGIMDQIGIKDAIKQAVNHIVMTTLATFQRSLSA